MFKKLAMTWALVATFLGIKDVPLVEGKVAFDDDQEAKLREKFGDEFVAQVTEAFNKELSSQTDADDLAKAREEVTAMLKESGHSDEETKEVLATDDLSKVDTAKMSVEYKQMAQNYLDLKATVASQANQIQKLMREPEAEGDNNIIKNAMNGLLKHSATHLFASGRDWDAIENRPWNARFLDGSVKATDFRTNSNIQLLQDDVEHFVRENPTFLNSLFDDFEDLPAEWSRKTGVLDRTATGSIMPEEIVQGRKKGWSPKNDFTIAAEEGKVWRKKIDIEFDGFELQELETTWVGSTQNMDGSQPIKNSFVAMLLSELVKQQKLDDRIAQINGIFSQTPNGDGNPGAAVNSQSGLRWLWWYYRDVTNQITPFSMGELTKVGVVDYIRTMIESIPVEKRTTQGWEIQISEAVYRWYAEKAGELYDLKFASDLGKQYYPLAHPIDFPNFKFQVIKDQTKTKFVGIVKSKNVQVLDYLENEKSKFTIEHALRNTFIYADYRLGIRFMHVGMKTEVGDPKAYDKQVMYCNDLPVFDSAVTAPLFDDTTGILKMNFNSVRVDKDWGVDITNIVGGKDGPYVIDLKGQIVTITGNPNLVGTPSVKDNANLDLTADFGLKTEGTLTLLALPNGKFKELSRTSAAPTPEGGPIAFTTATIDAAEGSEFSFTGTADVTLNSILNGVHGQQIVITKTLTGTIKLTIASVTGKIVVASTAELDAQNDTITLINVNGVWHEVSRTIA